MVSQASLDTIMGMFGLGVHSGLHREWTYIVCELGAAEQRANKIQHQNLLIEIAATKKSQHAAMAATKQQSLLESALPTSANDNRWCSAVVPPAGNSANQISPFHRGININQTWRFAHTPRPCSRSVAHTYKHCSHCSGAGTGS